MNAAGGVHVPMMEILGGHDPAAARSGTGTTASAEGPVQAHLPARDRPNRP